ncbi:MAG TPA: hypothetical protein VIJ60_07835, partial [Acidimicrobiales bacterium]
MGSNGNGKPTTDGGSGAKDDEPAGGSARRAAAAPDKEGAVTASPERPYTLAIDIGGTGLKASVLDATGAMVADRVRVPTSYPL